MCGFLLTSVTAPASSADCIANQEAVCLHQEEGEEAFRPGWGQYPSPDFAVFNLVHVQNGKYQKLDQAVGFSFTWQVLKVHL